MSSQSFKFLCLSGVTLSLLFSHSAAIAQSRDSSSGDVVVPTSSGNGTTRTTQDTYPNRNPYPSGDTYPNRNPYPSGDTYPNRNTYPNRDTYPNKTVSNGTRFSCQSYRGQYTVMYQPQSQQGQYFPWAIPRSLGDGWDAQKRCETIAQRLETYRPDGLLELQTTVENRQNVVCVTTDSNPSCRIVFTVPPEKDPYAVRNSVFENLSSADNGQQTVGVNTFTGSGGGTNDIYNVGRTLLGEKKPVSSSRDPINLKPFLDRADRGTASKLHNGVALRPQNPTGYRLNPKNFR